MDHLSTVLIADDTSLWRRDIEYALAGQGYRLAFASNGAEALEQAAALTPDLILLDVKMPGLDGYETCRRLRAAPGLAEVPVLMLSLIHISEPTRPY